jgi:hypothetical protein
MDKINKEYREHYMIKDFGLTSWAHTDELFPWVGLQECHILAPPSRSRQGHCGLILHDLFLMEPCAWFAKMGLVQKEGWPWSHANVFTAQCA